MGHNKSPICNFCSAQIYQPEYWNRLIRLERKKCTIVKIAAVLKSLDFKERNNYTLEVVSVAKDYPFSRFCGHTCLSIASRAEQLADLCDHSERVSEQQVQRTEPHSSQPWLWQRFFHALWYTCLQTNHLQHHHQISGVYETLYGELSKNVI